MKIEYYVIDPAGNITALVCSAVQKRFYKPVAQEIFCRRKEVEQVGFVSFDNGGLKLGMSGDEFCGNATMCAAALYYQSTGASGTRNIRVSALAGSEPVEVAVTKSGEYYECSCVLEPPRSVSEISFTAAGRQYVFPLVCFDGITHVIADGSLSEQAAQSVIRNLAKELSAKALGIMIFEGGTNTLRPIVYVSGVDTLFFENSCASGSCAVAAVYGKPDKAIEIRQPGGSITAGRTGRGIYLGTRLKITGHYLEETDYAEENGF